MRREIFSDEHEHFRDEFRRFADAEIVPHISEWNENGICDPSAWRKMGEAGYLGANAPEEYGGAGADFLFNVVVMEDCCAAGTMELHVAELEVINMIYCHVMRAAEVAPMIR